MGVLQDATGMGDYMLRAGVSTPDAVRSAIIRWSTSRQAGRKAMCSSSLGRHGMLAATCESKSVRTFRARSAQLIFDFTRFQNTSTCSHETAKRSSHAPIASHPLDSQILPDAASFEGEVGYVRVPQAFTAGGHRRSQIRASFALKQSRSECDPARSKCSDARS